MVERLLGRGTLTHALYNFVEINQEYVEAAGRRLRAWAASQDWQAAGKGKEALLLTRQDRWVEVRFHTQDIDAYARTRPPGEADFVLAHAFLDLVDWRRSAPTWIGLLRPGGVFYFTLNFDGLTAFLPARDPTFDERLMAAYHRTMDEGQSRSALSGGRHTGRHLLEQLPQMGTEILDAGPSDWLVRPDHGTYPGDEAYFLHFLVETVDRAVRLQEGIESGSLASWVAERHAQIERGEMVFLAHQWDVAGVRA
jgi:SAM-dependent methyltransferase